MADKIFTYAFRFGRAKVAAYQNTADLSDWQLALKHEPEEKALFESENDARQAVIAFLTPIVQEENTFHTPDRPVSARWRVYKLEQADHGTLFWYKGNVK